MKEKLEKREKTEKKEIKLAEEFIVFFPTSIQAKVTLFTIYVTSPFL